MKTNSLFAFVVKLSLLLNGIVTKETLKRDAYRDSRGLDCFVNLKQKNTIYRANNIPLGEKFNISCKLLDQTPQSTAYYVFAIKITKERSTIFSRNETLTIKYHKKHASVNKEVRFWHEGINSIYCHVQKYSENNKLLEACSAKRAGYVKSYLSSPYGETTKRTYYSRKKNIWTSPKFSTPSKSKPKQKITIRSTKQYSISSKKSTKAIPKNLMSKTDHSLSINQMLIKPIIYTLLFVSIYCLSIGTIITIYKIRPRSKK